MAIDSQHPAYADRVDDWDQVSDVYQGERRVKEQGTKYLPATSGMHADGMGVTQAGFQQYDAYRKRARVPSSYKEAVEAMVGIMHATPPKIELPERLEGMRYRATRTGESLESLLRRVNEHQLKDGRVGLLLDVPTGQGPADALPYISLYTAKSMINWDVAEIEGMEGEGPIMVVLDETGPRRRPDLTWEVASRYRFLTTTSLTPEPGKTPPPPVYRYQVLAKDQMPSEENLVTPQIGGRSLDKLPFVFVNHSDLVPDPVQPPLLGLSNTVLGIYRGEADYRQALFMQGQDTLVVIGDEEAANQASGTPVEVGATPKSYRVGAGASITLPKGGDAKFIGADSTGLSEMREALQNDRREASEQGISLTDTGGDVGGSSTQSGEALRVRVAAKTASLTQVAKTGGEAIEYLLELAAEWVGANPEEVSVEPNTDFADDAMEAAELAALQGAKAMGAPISRETIHENMQRRGMTKLTYEEEDAKIAEEEPMGGTGLGEPGALPVGQQPPAKKPAPEA